MNSLEFGVSNETDNGRSRLTIGVPKDLYDYMRGLALIKHIGKDRNVGLYYERADNGDRTYIVDPKYIGRQNVAGRLDAFRRSSQLINLVQDQAGKPSNMCGDKTAFLHIPASFVYKSDANNHVQVTYDVTATIQQVQEEMLEDPALEEHVLPHMASFYRNLYQPQGDKVQVSAGLVLNKEFYIAVDEPKAVISTHDRMGYAPALPLYGEMATHEQAFILAAGALAIANQARLQQAV